MKTCTRCKRSLPHAKFNKDRSRPDGLRSSCRDCRSIHERRVARTPQAPNLIPSPIEVKNRDGAYRQALIDLATKHRDEFQTLLQIRLREALTR